MATTQADLDALIAARNAGAKLVELPSGGRVIYNSLDDLNKAIGMAQRDLAVATGTVPVRRVKIWGGKDL